MWIREKHKPFREFLVAFGVFLGGNFLVNFPPVFWRTCEFPLVFWWFFFREFSCGLSPVFGKLSVDFLWSSFFWRISCGLFSGISANFLWAPFGLQAFFFGEFSCGLPLIFYEFLVDFLWFFSVSLLELF